jgi:hypothetical protein
MLNEPYRPGEASRALRKKLKHGNSHNQYRALVVNAHSSSIYADPSLSLLPDTTSACRERRTQIPRYFYPEL